MRTAGADGRRRGDLRGALALALLASVVAPVAPEAALAVDLPATQVLPGDAHSVVVVDLDADGATELVRIVIEGPRNHVVEAWGYRDDRWELIGSDSIPSLDPPAVDDGTALVVWRADGRARALVLVSCCSAQPDAELPACCFAAYELVPTPDGVALEARIQNQAAADFVQVMDIDGDGTDELVRSTNSFSGETGEIEVLRRDGEAFSSLYTAETDGGMVGLVTGDSDGVGGQDILIGPSEHGNLRRIVWVDGGLRTEEVHLGLGQRVQGWVTGVVRGTIVISMADQLQLVRWPHGEAPVRTARLAGLIYPYAAIVEAGTSAIVAVQGAGINLGQPTAGLGIYDLDLRELGHVDVAPIAARVERALGGNSGNRQWERYLAPYGGPLGAPSPGPSHGFVWAGMLVQADDDGYRAQPIAPLLGLQAMALAGPDDGWVVLSSGYLPTGTMAYLYPGSVPPGWGRISLAPIDDVLRADGVAPVIELRNAVAVGRDGDVTELVADGEGFEVVVQAPQGSWVVAWDGRSFDERTVETERLVLEISPPRSRADREEDEQSPIDASLIVATPDGHATVVEWTGSYSNGPAALSVSVRTEDFSFAARLEGTAGPHATVRVDGQPMAVDADGGFSASVEASLWPRTVLVSARDPLGNEVVERVEVIGVFDYRGLPWAAIVAAATVAVGAVLFVRIPRRRAPADVVEAGDGRLEELDPIDGTSFGER